MKFVPRHSQVFGRSIIKRVMSTIIRPDETKNTTKFLLVDAIGPGAAAAGIRVGDVVLATTVRTIVLDGGAMARPFVDEKDIAFVLTDVNVAEGFAMQVENGGQYVAFDSNEAAQSLGADPKPVETEKAA